MPDLDPNLRSAGMNSGTLCKKTLNHEHIKDIQHLTPLKPFIVVYHIASHIVLAIDC